MNQKLREIEQRLKKAARLIPFIDECWSDVPCKPGIYAIWNDEVVHSAVYVGETNSLRERFKDLKQWRNHTFTRKIKKSRRYTKPASIRSYISENYFISYLPLSLGRKEAEEYLIHEWETYEEFNKESPRYRSSRRHQYGV